MVDRLATAHRLRDPGQVRAWLVAIAANEARQTMRRQRRATIVDISEALDRHGGSDPADLIGVLDLERSLRKLPPDDRVLLALRFVADLDSTEIAAQLGISASGVRSRLARLLDRMRADLERPARSQIMNDRSDFEARIATAVRRLRRPCPGQGGRPIAGAVIARGSRRRRLVVPDARELPGSWSAPFWRCSVLGAAIVVGAYLLRPRTTLSGGGPMIIAQADVADAKLSTPANAMHVFGFDLATGERTPIADWTIVADSSYGPAQWDETRRRTGRMPCCSTLTVDSGASWISQAIG